MADHDERSPLLGGSNDGGIEPNQRIDDDQEIQRVHVRSRDSPQYEGLPEVKKKLRWIVPAVAIGASFFFFFFFFFLKKKKKKNVGPLSINIWKLFFFFSYA